MFTQFDSIIDLIAKFPTEVHCIEHLENLRWAGNVVSPFDPTSQVYKCKGNKYKCRKTGKYFNVRTETIFGDTKIPLQKWFIALYLLSSHKKGISSHQLAKDIHVTQKTAWFVLQRLRYAFNHPVFKTKLGNVVESDATYIGGKEANKHKIPRKYRGQAKIKSGTQGGAGKMVVLGMIERQGHVIAQHVTDSYSDTFKSIVKTNVRKGTQLMTDEGKQFAALGYDYIHRTVNHSAKEYVNGMAYTNTIEGFWSHMKRGIDGIYHSVSFKHLQKYVNEYALRYNSRKISESKRFNLILTNMVGRITYKELIG